MPINYRLEIFVSRRNVSGDSGFAERTELRCFGSGIAVCKHIAPVISSFFCPDYRRTMWENQKSEKSKGRITQNSFTSQENLEMKELMGFVWLMMIARSCQLSAESISDFEWRLVGFCLTS